MRISDWSSDVCSSDLSDDHEGSEAEATTTLDHLGDTVDRNDALDVRGLVGLLAATTVASTAVSAALALTTGALSALGSAHENYLFSFLLVFAIRTSGRPRGRHRQGPRRSEEHTSELQSLMRISYAVFCLKQQQYKT